MSDACWIQAKSMILYRRFFQDFGSNLVGAIAPESDRLVLNSCRIHADFIFTLNFTMLCATLCITMLLNACWILSEFKQNRAKYLNLPMKWHFKHLTRLLVLYTIENIIWDFSKATVKIVKDSDIFHGLAWTQHELNMNSTRLWCKVLHKALWHERYQWNQHEFSMNSTPIWFQLPYHFWWW